MLESPDEFMEKLEVQSKDLVMCSFLLFYIFLVRKGNLKGETPVSWQRSPNWSCGFYYEYIQRKSGVNTGVISTISD